MFFILLLKANMSTEWFHHPFKQEDTKVLMLPGLLLLSATDQYNQWHSGARHSRITGTIQTATCYVF